MHFWSSTIRCTWSVRFITSSSGQQSMAKSLLHATQLSWLASLSIKLGNLLASVLDSLQATAAGQNGGKAEKHLFASVFQENGEERARWWWHYQARYSS